MPGLRMWGQYIIQSGTPDEDPVVVGTLWHDDATGLLKMCTAVAPYAYTAITGGAGTVTSVGITVPSLLSVTGSPVTTSGTFAVVWNGTQYHLPYFSAAATLATSANLTFDAATLTVKATVAIDTSAVAVAPLTVKSNAAVGNYTPVNSGVIWRDAAGAESWRLWATPDGGGPNSGNQYWGYLAGANHPTPVYSGTGIYNIGIGIFALTANAAGSSNVAVGPYALTANTTGGSNIGIGEDALFVNQTTSNNVAIAYFALGSLTTGGNNVSIGYESLALAVTASLGVAVGFRAGKSVVGGGANTSATQSTFLGSDTKASAAGNTNEIVVGYGAEGAGSNTATWGNTSIVNHYFSGIVNLKAATAAHGAVPYSTATILAYTAVGVSGQVLTSAGAAAPIWTTPTTGTVTSVAMTVPTGLSVSGSPITGAGTLAVTLTAGYMIPGGGSAGQYLQSQGASAPAFSTATLPATATGTGTILRADGTNWVATTATYPATAPTAGAYLRADGTNWITSTLILPNAASAGDILMASGANTYASQARAALTKTDDTNVTLTLGGAPTTALITAASLTLGWTGQLGLTRGGTAASITAAHGAVVYSTAAALAVTAAGTSGQFLKSAGAASPVWADRLASLSFLIDGNGSAITTGYKGSIQIPFGCTITGWTILSVDASTTSGSIVIDVWKDTYANFPPTVADTITASAKPTVTTATKNTSTTLTGWTTAIALGDVVGFNVDSITSFTRVVIHLQVTKT